MSEIETTDGTMQDNAEALRDLVVGRRIVKAETVHVPNRYGYGGGEEVFTLTLDDGREVRLRDGGDCCAYTVLDKFLLHPERIDHVITGVSTEGDFTRWHIYADMGDVLELSVGWSSGNPFYYGYGFSISVEDIAE